MMDIIDRFDLKIPVEHMIKPSFGGVKVVYRDPCSIDIKVLKREDDIYIQEDSKRPVIIEKYQNRIVQNNYDPKMCAKFTDSVFSDKAPGMVAGLEEVCVDLGCGNGNFLRLILPDYTGKKAHYVGIDNDPHIILKEAQEATRWDSRYDFLLRDILKTELPDESAGLVTANFSLSYTVWPRLSMKEISRITKPGGFVFITDTYFKSSDFKRWMKEEKFRDVHAEDSCYLADPKVPNFTITARK